MSTYQDGLNTFLYDPCANTTVMEQRCNWSSNSLLNNDVNHLAPLLKEMYDGYDTGEVDDKGKPRFNLVLNKEVDKLIIDSNNKMRFRLIKTQIDGFGDCISSCDTPNSGRLKESEEEIEFGNCRQLSLCVPVRRLLVHNGNKYTWDLGRVENYSSQILMQILKEFMSNITSNLYQQIPVPNVTPNVTVPTTEAEWTNFTNTILNKLPISSFCATRYLLIVNNKINIAYLNNFSSRMVVANCCDLNNGDKYPNGFFKRNGQIIDSRIKHVTYADPEFMQTLFTYYSYNQDNAATGMKGGFAKAAGAKEIAWMLIPCEGKTPIGLTVNYLDEIAEMFYKMDSIFFSNRFRKNFAGFDNSIFQISPHINPESVWLHSKIGFGAKMFDSFKGQAAAATFV